MNNFREMCRMSWAVKRHDGSEAAGAREDITELTAVPDSCVPVEQLMVRDAAPKGVTGRGWVPVACGMEFQLPGKHRVVVKTVQCFHTVDDIG